VQSFTREAVNVGRVSRRWLIAIGAAGVILAGVAVFSAVGFPSKGNAGLTPTAKNPDRATVTPSIAPSSAVSTPTTPLKKTQVTTTPAEAGDGASPTREIVKPQVREEDGASPRPKEHSEAAPTARSRVRESAVSAAPKKPTGEKRGIEKRSGTRRASDARRRSETSKTARSPKTVRSSSAHTARRR
jgi:hypothetical protein